MDKKGLEYEVIIGLIITLIAAVLIIGFIIALKNGKLPASIQSFFDFLKFGR